MTATYDQLRTALRDTLEAKGVLRDVRARMQAEVFQAVSEPVLRRPGHHTLRPGWTLGCFAACAHQRQAALTRRRLA